MISVHNFLSADQIGINLVVVPSQNPVFYHKNIMAKAIRKLIDDARRSDYHELGLDSKGIGDVLEFPDICWFRPVDSFVARLPDVLYLQSSVQG
jgi:hypothetical protein